jgi:hypothetical protein
VWVHLSILCLSGKLAVASLHKQPFPWTVHHLHSGTGVARFGPRQAYGFGALRVRLLRQWESGRLSRQAQTETAAHGTNLPLRFSFGLETTSSERIVRG